MRLYPVSIKCWHDGRISKYFIPFQLVAPYPVSNQAVSIDVGVGIFAILHLVQKGLMNLTFSSMVRYIKNLIRIYPIFILHHVILPPMLIMYQKIVLNQNLEK